MTQKEMIDKIADQLEVLMFVTTDLCEQNPKCEKTAKALEASRMICDIILEHKTETGFENGLAGT